MRINIFVVGCMLAFFPAASSQAQVTIDASKITCDQFVHGKMGEPRTLAAWLSGFYNGKHNNTLVDTQKFQENLNSLQKFCYDEKNFKVTVMNAIARTMSAK